MDGYFVHQVTKLYWNSPKNWVGSNSQFLFVLLSKTTQLFQIILVEPDSTRLGWGVATFVGFLQDLEVVTDKDDSRCKFLLNFVRLALRSGAYPRVEHLKGVWRMLVESQIWGGIRERERDTHTHRERDRTYACVSVWVCECVRVFLSI
jgi:hypothetical protein